MSAMNELIADLEAIPLADMTERDQRTFAAAIGHLRRLFDRVHMLEIREHRAEVALNLIAEMDGDQPARSDWDMVRIASAALKAAP